MCITDPITASPRPHLMLQDWSTKANYCSSWILQGQPQVFYQKLSSVTHARVIQQQVKPLWSSLWILVGRCCSSALVNAERPSNRSKQTSHKKRELEQDLTTDVQAKCTKADDSKKVGRLGVKEPGNDCPETVAASKPSKQPKPSKLSEPSKPSKPEEKKRKHLDVQELAESSQPIKCIKKSDSPMPVTLK